MTIEKTNAPGANRGVQRSSSVVAADDGFRVTRYPVTYAALHGPAEKRRLWWITYRCPHCGSSHFGRARDRDGVTGVRRSGCGRLVWVVVARTYPGGGR